MCGIFGFTGYKENQLVKAREALHVLKHRGPDQWSDYNDENLYIGHQRLSILDLSEFGKQPMISPDKKVIIAVNGEIYNFLELRKELEKKYTFQSTSDSEVVLYGYMEWGIDSLVERIDGMYSISIYDKKTNALYLVRDRAGIKPIYYSTLSQQFLWASELKAIEKFYENDEVLNYDYTALFDFLTYRFIPTPKSQYKRVFKLEPGHYMKVDTKTNNFDKVQYWELKVNKCNDDIEIASQKIETFIKESVNEQMISDVPVGFFLSGGMDSSAVVSIASLKYTNINTFSIGFTDKAHDETAFADLVAQRFNTQHHQKILDQSEVQLTFHKIKDWYDEPFGDTSCFPTFMVSKFAKEKVTVALTGDGGDEIFGGYNWYKTFEKAHNSPLKNLKWFKGVIEKLSFIKGTVGNIFRKLAILLISDEVEKYAAIRGSLSHKQKEKYRKAWRISDDYDDFWYYRKYYKKELDIYTRLQFVDFNTYLPDDILTKVDRVSMAVSLECRVPLLKKELIEYCFSLDQNVCIANGELKGVMKKTFDKYLPHEITHRSKRGFSIPLKKWSNLLDGKETKQEKILAEFNLDVK